MSAVRRRAPAWPYALLGVALLSAVSFGWYQTRQNNQLALDAENRYMAAFHRLKWTSENMEERTSRLMATNDPQLQESLLGDLRVFSAQAVEHMSALPFTTLNTPRLENFVNRLRDRSDQYYYKLANGGRLSQADWEALNSLREQTVFFEAELSQLLGLVGSNMLKWRDTARVTHPNDVDKGGTTPITESVVHMDGGLEAPPQQQGAENKPGPLPRPKTDPGPRVDAAQAAEAVKRFLDMPVQQGPTLTHTTDAGDRGGFSLYYFDVVKENGLPLTFGVSIHGGHVIHALDGRLVPEKRLRQDELIRRATELLEKWGYPPMVHLSAAENDNTLVMDFAPVKNGVAVHIERVKVMLAMDNAELVGFDAREYWLNRHERQAVQPKLSATAAAQRISPRLVVSGQPRLSLIADNLSDERLTWLVPAKLDNQRYHVFIDANTGAEVDIQRLAGDPAPPLQAGR